MAVEAAADAPAVEVAEVAAVAAVEAAVAVDAALAAPERVQGVPASHVDA